MYGTQQVADTLFAPSVPYANLGLKPSQYDPQKAKALLEKAGWTLPAGKDIREKNGQPLEKLLSHYVQARFLRPKIRPYKTNNYYAILMRGGSANAVLEKDR